eukprot:TRINITY_DN23861_c1_g1_i3.p2 TRINITY_DN23861_c1_g1~~TRINITY_DN23861_c1_g1_i3.p2  ORF type:complete len:143 (+),score=14.95 TRINITY_DN23861_c1_g1_i3:294-722(+)
MALRVDGGIVRGDRTEAAKGFPTVPAKVIDAIVFFMVNLDPRGDVWVFIIADVVHYGLEDRFPGLPMFRGESVPRVNVVVGVAKLEQLLVLVGHRGHPLDVFGDGVVIVMLVVFVVVASVMVVDVVEYSSEGSGGGGKAGKV